MVNKLHDCTHDIAINEFVTLQVACPNGKEWNNSYKARASETENFENREFYEHRTLKHRRLTCGRLFSELQFLDTKMRCSSSSLQCSSGIF